MEYLSVRRSSTSHRTGAEGVAKVWMCYDRFCHWRKQNRWSMARYNDHLSAALFQLSRYRYCLTWEDPAREAPLSLPRARLCRLHLPACRCLCRSIACREATDNRYGHFATPSVKQGMAVLDPGGGHSDWGSTSFRARKALQPFVKLALCA